MKRVFCPCLTFDDFELEEIITELQREVQSEKPDVVMLCCRLLAEGLKCPTSPAHSMVRCLREVSLTNLLSVTKSLQPRSVKVSLYTLLTAALDKN